MNYLAHLHLAGEEPLAQVGALMGDFVKGPLAGRFSEPLRAAIGLHRHIDSYTDAHPAFRRSRARLPAGYRRFGGVIVDVFYDHLLARDWERHHPIALERYAQTVYSTLRGHMHLMPATMQTRVQGLIRNDLLVAYRRLDTIETALTRIGGRLKRPVDLGQATASLRQQMDAFQLDFDRFYPDLRAFVRAEAASHQTASAPLRVQARPVICS